MKAFSEQKLSFFRGMNLISVAGSSLIWNILMNANTRNNMAVTAADNSVIAHIPFRMFVYEM